MRRRRFLKGVSASLAFALRRYRAHALSELKQPRVAFGGIGIECSTYSRIRTRMEDFEILKGEGLAESQRFAFLKKYSTPFIPTVVAQAVPGGPVEKATYDAIKAEFLAALQALASAGRPVSSNARCHVCGRNAGCRRRLDGSHP